MSEHAAYHHGEASLQKTIVGMAQDFVGSNNVNLLVPSGQFGTRSQGGEDQASPRYIFTRLAKIARKIFHPHDDAVLTTLLDDGVAIEPEYYVPVIPMALVNGSDGIGTGWSSTVPMFNPRDIVANLRRMIDGEECEPMVPWYRDFTGAIAANGATRYEVRGVAEHDEEENTLIVSELPVGSWTQRYKESLEAKLNAQTIKHGKNEKTIPALVKEFEEHHTDRTVDFRITLTEGALPRGLTRGAEKDFGLIGSLSTSNMVMWNAADRITTYATVEQIMRDFYDVRVRTYDMRKAHLLSELSAEHTKLSNRARFIEAFVEGELEIGRRAESAVAADLDAMGFVRIHTAAAKKSAGDAATEGSAAALPIEGAAGYDYLLSLSLRSLTLEKVTKLNAEVESLETQLNTLRAASAEDLWIADLDDLVVALDEEDALRAKETAEMAKARAKAVRKGRGAPPKRKAARKAKATVCDADADADWSPEAEARPKSKAKARKKAAPKAAPKAKANKTKASKPKANKAKVTSTKRAAKSALPLAEVTDQLQSMALHASPAAKKPSKRAASRATPLAMKDWTAEDGEDDASGSDSDYESSAPLVPRSKSNRARPAISYAPAAIDLAFSSDEEDGMAEVSVENSDAWQIDSEPEDDDEDDWSP